MFDFLIKIFKPVTERLINKYTPKGISTVIVAVLLQYFGANEDILMVALAYDWDFVETFYVWTSNHTVAFYSFTILLTAIGGFYIFRKDIGCIHQNKLQRERFEQEQNVEILKLKIEQKKLEKELEDANK